MHPTSEHPGAAERAQASPRIFRPDEEGELHPVESGSGDDDHPGPALAAVHAALLAFVRHDAYPCVGAKAAINHRSHRVGFYGSFADSAAGLVEDLCWFGAHADGIDERFATFVSVFTREPAPADDAAFEAGLWDLLRRVHEGDGSAWDPAVSADPADPEFSFSVGGRAFFVIGMHPLASREARRFPYPVIVWNLHAQFERLRDAGRFEPMRDAIREREEALEGTPNPGLADHGDRSEAAQYAGVPHGEGWSPRFHAWGEGACPFLRAESTPEPDSHPETNPNPEPEQKPENGADA